MSIPISDLAPVQIRGVVFEALRHGDTFRADLIDHLVDLVDWRHAPGASRETIAMLRILGDASDRYELGELSLDGYRDLSVSLFFPAHSKRAPRRPHQPTSIDAARLHPRPRSPERTSASSPGPSAPAWGDTTD